MKKSLLTKITAAALSSAIILGSAACGSYPALVHGAEAGNASNIVPEILSEETIKKIQDEVKKTAKKTPLKLNKKEESKDVNPIKGGLFKTRNGVECRSVSVTYTDYSGMRTYAFGVELYNNTGSDKTFDPRKFMIETRSGKLVYPCLMPQVRHNEKVKSEFKRLYTSYNLYDYKDLKPKQKASVYYDGVLIKKVTVHKFGAGASNGK